MQYNNLLLIAGTGRNTGKTSLVSYICQNYNANNPLVCIKISIHYHPQQSSVCIYECPQFKIYEETISSSDKDTSRMLAAGASKVYFIESESTFVYNAFIHCLKYIPNNAAIICESGSLRDFIKPALFILIHTSTTQPKNSSVHLFTLADKVMEFAQGQLNFSAYSFTFVNNTWNLTTT